MSTQLPLIKLYWCDSLRGPVGLSSAQLIRKFGRIIDRILLTYVHNSTANVCKTAGIIGQMAHLECNEQ